MKKLIKRIIREEIDNFEWVEEIKPYLINPKLWLSEKMLSCIIKKIKSGNWKGWTFYTDPNGKVLFADNVDIENKDHILCFDSYIFIKLNEMGLNYDEMRKICIEVLWEIHKRKVIEAKISYLFVR